MPVSASPITQCDIAIVGGGMVGMSLASLLSLSLPQKHIVSIDASPSRISTNDFSADFDARTTAISSQSIEILRHMGVWDRLSEHISEILQVHVSDRGHWGKASYSKAENGDEPLGVVAENVWLNQCLGHLLAENDAVSSIWSAEVDDVTMNSAGARVSYRRHGDPHTLQCTLLVAADGAQSRLRKTLGIAADIYDYQQSAVIANVEFESAHGGIAFERFTDEGPIALLPLGECPNARRSSLVWTLPHDKVDAVLQCDNQVFLSLLQARFGYRLGKFLRASQRRSYPLKRVLAREQVRSSFVLMGNAAHALHPVAGQGFNLALRDAAALADALALACGSGKSINSLAALQMYEQSRYWDQQVTLSLSHQFNDLFRRGHAAAKIARNVGLAGLNVSSSAKQTFFQQMMGHGGFEHWLK